MSRTGSGFVVEHRPVDVDLRAARLAELVSELTGCSPAGALHAVRADPSALATEGSSDGGDPLEVVARAMLHVDRPDPEGFRITGFLRDDLVIDCRDEPASARLPQRVHGGLPHRQPLV
jgi:hypothetical protein